MPTPGYKARYVHFFNDKCLLFYKHTLYDLSYNSFTFYLYIAYIKP